MKDILIGDYIKAKKPSPSSEFMGMVGKLGSYITNGSYLISTNNAYNVPLVFKQYLDNFGKSFGPSTTNKISESQGPSCADKWEAIPDNYTELQYTCLDFPHKVGKDIQRVGVFVANSEYYAINLNLLSECAHFIGHNIIKLWGNSPVGEVYITALNNPDYYGLIMPYSIKHKSDIKAYLKDLTQPHVLLETEAA